MEVRLSYQLVQATIRPTQPADDPAWLQTTSLGYILTECRVRNIESHVTIELREQNGG
jgi:hypothetical protein